MIEQDIITDLVKHRVDVFTSLSLLVKLGFKEDDLLYSTQYGIDAAINAPSFNLGDLKGLDMTPRMIIENRIALPFETFSIINNMGDIVQVTSISRIDQSDLRTLDHVTPSGVVDGIGAAIFIRKNKKWLAQLPILSILSATDGGYHLVWGNTDYTDEEIGARLKRMTTIISDDGTTYPDAEALTQFLNPVVSQVMSMVAMTMTRKELTYRGALAVPRTAIQVAKAKKPFWEYKVVKLKELQKTKEYLGGHHAPPKWHKVKGHTRTYTHERFSNAKGKTIYIPEYEKGDKALGGVLKDYELS